MSHFVLIDVLRRLATLRDRWVAVEFVLYDPESDSWGSL